MAIVKSSEFKEGDLVLITDNGSGGFYKNDVVIVIRDDKDGTYLCKSAAKSNSIQWYVVFKRMVLFPNSKLERIIYGVSE